ncbi:MAG: RNA-binding domain-containing protein [Thermoplasmata archaeon]
MDIKIETEIHPTEEPERVRQAVLNLFPDAMGDFPADGAFRMTASDAAPFFTRISEQKIRDTARNILLRSILGSELRFHLNKQAAFSGRVNFTEGNSILGDIEVVVIIEQPEELVLSMLGGTV